MAACTSNFNCGYFFSSHTANPRFGEKAVCCFTFYGIATNASLAAFAFAAAFNRIACLAAAHVVPDREFDSKRASGEIVCSKGTYTAAARDSYRGGLARGLSDAVRQSLARKEIEQQKRLEMARSKASRGEAWESSDDDDDGDNGGGDGGGGGGGGGGDGGGSGGGDTDDDDEVKVKLELADGGGGDKLSLTGGDASTGDVKQEGGIQAATVAETVVNLEVKLEREAKAATALVSHTEKVKESFLKEAGIKLSKAKHTYTQSVYRHASYVQGEVDSKEIDINQKSIAGPTREGHGT